MKNLGEAVSIAVSDQVKDNNFLSFIENFFWLIDPTELTINRDDIIIERGVVGLTDFTRSAVF